MIQVTCPNCGLTILAPPAVQGRKGVCFGCGGPLRVPHSSQDAGLDDLAYAPGTRISDRYVIDESIGRGGMGVVYRADDTLMSETVALKFMYPKLLRTQKGHNLFVQEAQVARRLRHDNIVAVHDVTSTPEGILYLSMEFLQGKSLRAFLRHRRRVRKLMSVRLAVRVVTQALSALEHAHRTVVHRDMKPENIMVLPGERVKVLDFGLAKALDEEARDPATDEKPKRIVGTEAYAAPEQKRHEDLDGRADLYSTGLILREMLTLRTPAEDQVAVQAVRGDVAPSLLEVLDKAIHPNREARWQTAGAFRDALLAAFEKSYRAPEAAAVQTASGKNVSTDGMVYLEGGSFLMGNNGNPVEAPEYAASVDAFYMDACPVTVAQYAEFLEATGHAPPEFWKESDFDGGRSTRGRGDVERRTGVREVGRQTTPDGSAVGVRGTRQGKPALSLGQPGTGPDELQLRRVHEHPVDRDAARGRGHARGHFRPGGKRA